MTIGVARTGAWAASNSGSPTNVPYPATVDVNDYMLLIASVQTPSGVGSITTPSGWTLLTPPGFLVSNAGAGTPGLAVYSKFAAGTEDGTNQSVAYTSTTPNFAAMIVGFSGVDLTTPLDATTTSVDSAVATSTTLPGQTIVTAGATQVAVAALNSTSATAAPPSGFTEIGDTTSFRAMEVSYIGGLGTGASGNRVVDWSPASARSVGILLALRPAAAGAADWGVSRITGTSGSPVLTPVTITPL